MQMAEGKSYTELSRARDKNLVAIIKALRARDAKQAVRAMRHHLAKTAEHWLTPREATAEE